MNLFQTEQVRKPLLFFSLLFFVLTVSCKKQAQTSVPMVSVTMVPVAVTDRTAKSGGTIASDGGASITEHGLCWSTAPKPTIEANNHKSAKGNHDTFTDLITGLSPFTKYYLRAYAINAWGIGYGPELSFTTLRAVLPALSTPILVSGSLEASSARVLANVTGQGTSAVTGRGFCWSSNPIPTIEDDHMTLGGGLGSISYTINDLNPSQKYYVRAYATNSEGTNYSQALPFTTLSSVIPRLAAPTVSNILDRDAALGGVFLSAGNFKPLVYKGICLSQLHNPTLGRSDTKVKTLNGPDIGAYAVNASTVNAAALASNTTYYIRTVAVDSRSPKRDTIYSQETSFKTTGLATIDSLTWELKRITTSGLLKYAETNINLYVSDDGGQEITERGVCYSMSNPTPTINDSYVKGPAGGLGGFTVTCNFLALGGNYYVRGYAINESGISYGPVHDIYVPL